MLYPSFEEEFDHYVRNPTQWFFKAQTLRIAARELFKVYKQSFEAMEHLDGVSMEIAGPVLLNTNLYQPAGMLAGFSLEVLIKANIAAQYPERVKPNMKVKDWTGGKQINGHDLVELSKHASLTISDNELLVLLTKFSIWKGRYPSNMDGTPMYGTQGEFENLAGTHWIEISQRYEAEYDSIQLQVRNNIDQ